MRISDWSSDVFSSDLDQISVARTRAVADARRREYRDDAQYGDRDRRGALRLCDLSLRLRPLLDGDARGLHLHGARHGRRKARALHDHLFEMGQCRRSWRRPGPSALLVVFLGRSEAHTSELQSLMRISYAV